MNKGMLIDKLAAEIGISKTAASAAIDSMVDGISAALRENEKVTLSGFGSWNVSTRKARSGRNPRTGESVLIKAKKSVRFKPGKTLDGMLNC